ncbi:MAG TPA: glyoxalase/bleomycin resistance/dioxygenase family protein [Acidimicrobiaceae bacterium]|nr:glyoxalase/bleomycin resistance/dioxygenase family protein [Acidimicrobiaceae bacterium]
MRVSDLARSRRFYENALGFRFWWEFDAPDEASRVLLGLPSLSGLHATYLVRDGLVLELLHVSGGDQRPTRPRTFDDPGLTHLSLAVEDRAGILAKVRQLGGEVLESSDVGAAVMVRDPDGQLIELTSWAWRSKIPPLPA